MAIAAQTTYSERMAPPSPGSPSGSDYDTITGLCETTAPGIPFGRAVSQGTLSDKGMVLGGTLAAFRGVSLKDITLASEQDAYLPPNSMFHRSNLYRGLVCQTDGRTVNANPVKLCRPPTGTFNKSTGLGPIKGARWETSCGVGGRALLQLSGYNLAT